LIGRHFRLREELACAVRTLPWNPGHIDRIIAEIEALEREISGLQGQSDPVRPIDTYRYNESAN
jgi:hypothetical protein